MTRRYRSLCLSALAALALSGVLAAAAHAVPAEFKSPAKNSAYAATGVGIQAFSFDVGTAECSELAALGVTGAAETAPTLATTSFEYKGECEAFALPLTVKSNGCNYTLHAGEKNAGGSEKGTLDIVCPMGKSIEFITAVCTVKIGAQNGLGKITYKNEVTGGGIEDILAEVELTGISYSWNGANCGNGAKANGTYNGKIRLSIPANNLTIV